MNPPEEVEVWVAGAAGDRRAGVLRPSFAGGRALASSSFEYDSAYLADGWQISPDLPLRAGRQYTAANATLPGAFSDAAPDDWGRRLIVADHSRRRDAGEVQAGPLGEFDFLLGASDHTRMGALRFARDGTWLSTESGVANFHDLARLVDAARRYDDDEATDDDIAYLGDVATSPGGARPKANVQLPDGRLALAKLPHSKDGGYDVERWEAVALTLARLADLRVPEWSLEAPVSGRGVLVIRRFDRDDAGGRLGYLSARTAFELGAHDDGSRLTYEDFTDVISDLSVSPADDLHEMFGRIALTVLLNNVDDHWQNHGFIRTASGWRLSPLFDVNPARRRGMITSRPISTDDDPRDRRLTHLLAVADAFRLRDADARAILHRVSSAVTGWAGVAETLGVPAAQREAYRGAFDLGQREWALGLV